ncbi:Pheromone a factor receptor [Pleurostoma richardsiae]|uniref:Pheromone a factor receptor n=1 Tax=Pleurostoma richardsiae TaxID=41990 RepID=A0AA38VLR8_9PEZI|nr:Pheromone a factor receptor [Pleurostoma richardsiae]
MDPAASSGTSSTSLLLNVIFRALFSLAAAAGCWVPMRLLWKNGELAGATFTVIVIIFNLFNAINCLIWHDDNINHWWKGEGWCDIQVYVTLPLETMYAACVLAIVRHIANQVALMRVTGLSGKEKRRKLIVQCLIIFPVPLVQVALTYLILAGRYSILAVVGCRPIYAPSWLALVFFVLPCPIFALLAAYFAVVIYFRYRQIDAATRAAVWDSNNSSAQSRSARTKRKLYFMSVCVVIPYLPIQIAYLVLNLLSDGPWTGPYSFSKTHGPTWSYIFMVPSDAINWVIMYQGYISVLTVIPIFIFFARTKEAHDTYRKYLRSIGLGKIWPKLNEEWFPDRSRVGSLGSGSRSWRSRVSELASASSSLRYSRKGSLAPTRRDHVGTLGSAALCSRFTTLSDYPGYRCQAF